MKQSKDFDGIISRLYLQLHRKEEYLKIATQLFNGRDSKSNSASETTMRRAQIDYLPRQYVLSKGRRIVIRNYDDDKDEKKFFSLTMSASANGDGFTVDEFPTISSFLRT